ncbi:hypothetical protein LBMAG57_33740 [Verrucomicrobiota bacterium]|nr:hypothetical protein LBMAG57_33740 [Verrucomicrobiota bacterium]
MPLSATYTASNSASLHFSTVATCTIMMMAASSDCSAISQPRVARIITIASTSTLSADGIRAAQVLCPKTFNEPAMHHCTRGGFFKKGFPPT